MNQRILLALGAAFLGLAGLLGVLAWAMSGLPSELQQDYRRISKESAQVFKQVDTQRARYQQVVDEHGQVLTSFVPVWQQTWTEAEQHIEAAKAALAKADVIVERDDEAEEQQLLEALRTAATEASSADRLEQSIRAQVERCSKILADLPSAFNRAHGEAERVASYDFTALEADLRQAQEDWPGKQEDLQGRLDGLKGDRARAIALAADLPEQPPTDLADFDLKSFYAKAKEIADLRQRIDDRLAGLPKRIAQLYHGWEKILVDQAIDEGREVLFRQRFKQVITEVPREAEAEPQIREQNLGWQTVSRQTYERDKEYLGMSLWRKPPGHYDEEQQRIPQAPGLAYVADPQQGRNRYGEWQRHSNGTNFWMWYGGYRMMGDLFHGGRYRPYSHDDYHGYRNSLRNRRPYYGQAGGGGRLFGAGGSATRSSYPNSRYVRTGGFKNSRYVKSGGKFRGTRYQSSGSRTSSRSQRSSSFGGGSRSFGGK